MRIFVREVMPMLFAGNCLYFSPEELEAIETEAADEGKTVVEKIEALLRDREPDFVDVIMSHYGGFTLYKLGVPEAKSKFGEIGNPKRRTVH